MRQQIPECLQNRRKENIGRASSGLRWRDFRGRRRELPVLISRWIGISGRRIIPGIWLRIGPIRWFELGAFTCSHLRHGHIIRFCKTGIGIGPAIRAAHWPPFLRTCNALPNLHRCRSGWLLCAYGRHHPRSRGSDALSLGTIKSPSPFFAYRPCASDRHGHQRLGTGTNSRSSHGPARPSFTAHHIRGKRNFTAVFVHAFGKRRGF